MHAGSKQSAGWLRAIKRPFEIFDRALDLIERTILIAAILAMATVSMLNVITRNMGASISWADEVTQLLVVVVTFVGLGHGVRMARHIRVSAIHDILPPQGQKILLIFISLTTSALLFALTIFAMQYVYKLMESGRVVPSLGIPIYYVYLIAPIGLFIGAAQYLLAFIRNLISPDAWLSWQRKDEYEQDEQDLELAEARAPTAVHGFDADPAAKGQGGSRSD